MKYWVILCKEFDFTWDFHQSENTEIQWTKQKYLTTLKHAGTFHRKNRKMRNLMSLGKQQTSLTAEIKV